MCSDSSESCNRMYACHLMLFFFLGFKKRETEVYVGNLPLDISKVFFTIGCLSSLAFLYDLVTCQ